MERNKQGYLFVYFTGETEQGEQIYFSLSEDGLHWKDLHHGLPVLQSSLGEKGVRDPYILRSELDGNFYIMATDLRLASGKNWETARSQGSKKIIFWSSSDLIRWSEPWAYEVPMGEIGCVWAPEACYDSRRRTYLVFWASLTREEGEANPKHRIFCSRTEDFRRFTAPQKYMERESHVIDTTIVRKAGKYYRFTKDAAAGGIVMDCGKDLQEPFTVIHSESLRRITGVEGPLAFLLPDGRTWCLMADQFERKMGYLPLLCSDLEKGDFRVLPQDRYDLGKNRKRHGSVLRISGSEYERLKSNFYE